MGERKNLKELLEKSKANRNKKASLEKEGETPLFREEGFDVDPFEHEELIKSYSGLHWKYMFSMAKSKPKIKLNPVGKESIFNQVKVIDYGDVVDVYTIDYTNIKPISNSEEITYTKLDAQLLANKNLESKTKTVNYITSISKELADNKPYILKNVVNFFDDVFINYFNEDKGHVVYIKNTFDSLLHNIKESDEFRTYTYKTLIAESSYRRLNVKISFTYENSDFVWSVYENLIQDMKDLKKKINKGNLYFSDHEKEIENRKLSLLLAQLTKIKDRYEKS